MKFREQIFTVYENKDVIINLCKYFEFINKKEFMMILKILNCKNYDGSYDQFFIFLKESFGSSIKTEMPL
jgi:hypothetical protein